MKNTNQLILTLTVAMMFAGCGKTNFAEISEPSVTKESDDVVDPLIPPVPVTGYKLSNGACNPDSSTNVLSCVKCNVPVNPPVRQLSKKAQALADAMFLACQVSNKSDHNNFRPTKEMIIEKLNRGSDALYPDTPRTAQMEMVIQGLTNEHDDSMRKKMFGGLWYTASYSDAFETYFGLQVQEAKSTFCWNGDKKTPEITDRLNLVSKDMLDCMYGSGGYAGICKEKPAYVAAQEYRKQLDNVLSKSISSPYVAPEAAPQKVCSWDKFEGDNLTEARKILKLWQSEGRVISMEVTKGDGVGFCGTASTTNLKEGVAVAIATYSCK